MSFAYFFLESKKAETYYEKLGKVKIFLHDKNLDLPANNDIMAIAKNIIFTHNFSRNMRFIVAILGILVGILVLKYRKVIFDWTGHWLWADKYLGGTPNAIVLF